MAAKKKIKDFKNLEQYPDLKKALIPSFKTLPSGSMNTKVIINEGEVIERVYKTPNGEIISLFLDPIDEEAAWKSVNQSICQRNNKKLPKKTSNIEDKQS